MKPPLRHRSVRPRARRGGFSPFAKVVLSLFVVKAVHYGGAKTNGVNNIPPQMRTAAAVSFAEKKQANWNVRGAWKDSFWLDFDGGWVFPHGTNHLAGVEVVSFVELGGQAPFWVMFSARRRSFSVS